MPERFTRNVARDTPSLFVRVCDALARAILIAFVAAAAASLDIAPPFGIVACAALGGLAVVWIVR